MMSMDVNEEHHFTVSDALKVQNEISQANAKSNYVDPTPSTIEEKTSIPTDSIRPSEEAPSGQSEEPSAHSNEPDTNFFSTDVGVTKVVLSLVASIPSPDDLLPPPSDLPTISGFVQDEVYGNEETKADLPTNANDAILPGVEEITTANAPNGDRTKEAADPSSTTVDGETQGKVSGTSPQAD